MTKKTMDFGDALRAMKRGERVRRVGWNGKGMHVYIEDLPPVKIRGGVFKGATRVYAPVVALFTAQQTHQLGWVASQADMLADDWQIVT